VFTSTTTAKKEEQREMTNECKLILFSFYRPLSDDNFFEKMRTGVSNNNKIYAERDKFENIDNLSSNNTNNNNSPSIDLLNYSNNNVYADIVDLDDTETLSLMYSQNAQQFDRGRHDRTLSNSSARANDEQSFYLANSSVTSRSFGSYRQYIIFNPR
jgi:uncharacterized protein YdiU (UPF0061 family)